MVIACSPTGMPRNGVLRLDRARRQRGSDLVCKVQRLETRRPCGARVGRAASPSLLAWYGRLYSRFFYSSSFPTAGPVT